MPAEARTFTLPAEQLRYLDGLVASGSYATADQAVEAGLRALQEREEDLERWLRDEVVPVAAAMQADPGRAIPADQVVANLHNLARSAAIRGHMGGFGACGPGSPRRCAPRDDGWRG